MQEQRLTATHTELQVIATLNQAWKHIKGAKLAIWLVVICMILISTLLNLLVYSLFGIDEMHTPYWIRFILMPILSNVLVAPFYAGAVMTAIQHIRGEKTVPASGFFYFKYYLPLAIALIIITFIASIGMMIINIPTVAASFGKNISWLEGLAALYSTIIYTFFILTIPLIADKNKQPFKAMRASFNLVKPHWLKVFAIILISYFVILLFTVPLFLGISFMKTLAIIIGGIILIGAAIWLIPWIFMIQGMIYHLLVDVKKKAIDETTHHA